MIKIEKDTHVVAIWYVAGAERDWFACLTRTDEAHVLKYRFRHYGKNEIFDTGEIKGWWGARWAISAGAQVPEQGADDVAASIASQHGQPVQKLSVNGDGEKAMEMLAEQPFAHVQQKGLGR